MKRCSPGDVEVINLLIKTPGIRLVAAITVTSPRLPMPCGRIAGTWWNWLAGAGASVNVQVGDFDGNTPLHLAAERGDAISVQWLPSMGADPQMANFRQLTPLEVVRSSGITSFLRQER